MNSSYSLFCTCKVLLYIFFAKNAVCLFLVMDMHESADELHEMIGPLPQEIRIALDEILQKKHMTRYQLSKLTSINYQTIDNYYKNRVDRYDSVLLLKMCQALGCEVGELVRIIYVENGKKQE